MRRVQRRREMSDTAEMSDYAAHLRDKPVEATALYKDLLIGVTQFFREPEAYRILAERVVP